MPPCSRRAKYATPPRSRTLLQGGCTGPQSHGILPVPIVRSHARPLPVLLPAGMEVSQKVLGNFLSRVEFPAAALPAFGESAPGVAVADNLVAALVAAHKSILSRCGEGATRRIHLNVSYTVDFWGHNSALLRAADFTAVGKTPRYAARHPSSAAFAKSRSASARWCAAARCQ